MPLPRTTAAALTVLAGVLVLPLGAGPAAAAPSPAPSPSSGSLLDLVPSLVNGLLTGPVATVGSTGGGLDVGVLPAVGSTPLVRVTLPGVLDIRVGGTGSAAPSPTVPPPSPVPTVVPPSPSPRTPRPSPSGTTSAAVAGPGALSSAPPGPSTGPTSPSPSPSRSTERPIASLPLVDSIRESIPAALALAAGTVLFGVAVLYLMSILGTGRRRSGVPLAPLAVAAPGSVVGAVVVDDPDWDFTLDASGETPARA